MVQFCQGQKPLRLVSAVELRPDIPDWPRWIGDIAAEFPGLGDPEEKPLNRFGELLEQANYRAERRAAAAKHRPGFRR